jgi:hypothetical protein
LHTWRTANSGRAITRTPDTSINQLLSLEKQYFSVDETRPVVSESRTLAMLEAATPAHMRPVGQGSHKARLDQATMGDE